MIGLSYMIDIKGRELVSFKNGTHMDFFTYIEDGVLEARGC